MCGEWACSNQDVKNGLITEAFGVAEAVSDAWAGVVMEIGESYRTQKNIMI